MDAWDRFNKMYVLYTDRQPPYGICGDFRDWVKWHNIYSASKHGEGTIAKKTMRHLEKVYKVLHQNKFTDIHFEIVTYTKHITVSFDQTLLGKRCWYNLIIGENDSMLLDDPILILGLKNFKVTIRLSEFVNHFNKYISVIFYNNHTREDLNLGEHRGLPLIRNAYKNVMKKYIETPCEEEFILEGNLHIVYNFYANLLDDERLDVKVMAYEDTFNTQFNHYYTNGLDRSYHVQGLHQGIEHLSYILNKSKLKTNSETFNKTKMNKDAVIEDRVIKLLLTEKEYESFKITRACLSAAYAISEHLIDFAINRKDYNNVRDLVLAHTFVSGYKQMEVTLNLNYKHNGGLGINVYLYDKLTGNLLNQPFEKTGVAVEFIKNEVDKRPFKCDHSFLTIVKYCPECGTKLK